MKKSLYCFLFVLLVCVTGVLAQSPSERTPPKVLLIVREEIKPGMMPAHSKHSAVFAGIFSKLQTPNHRIALVPVAGNENEVLYVTAGETFAELEKITQDTDKKMASVPVSMRSQLDRLEKEAPELHNSMRDMLAVYRPDLSYKPGVPIPQMRYMAVTTVRIRPGMEDRYGEYIRTMVNIAREKINADLHVAAFQVIAGTPGTTYMMFRPMKSLAEYDQRIGPRAREAMTDDQRKNADKMASESIMFSETSIYAMAPSLSYVDKEFAAGDPTFWNPARPEIAVRPKPRRRTAPPPPPPSQE